MSYINDALRKAQKENKTDSGRFGRLLSAAQKEARVSPGWYSAAGILVIVVFAAGMIALLHWPLEKQSRTDVHPPGLATGILSDDAAAIIHPEALAPAEADPDSARSGLTTAGVPEETKTGYVEGEQPPFLSMAEEETSPVIVKDPDMLYAQALKLQQDRHMTQAETLYIKLLEIDPRHLAAINNLGVLYMQQKKYQQAIARFDEALHVRHDYVKAHYNLACVYARQNDVDRSLFYLKNALDFNPGVRKWVQEDQDFKNLAGLPEFKNMMKKRSD